MGILESDLLNCFWQKCKFFCSWIIILYFFFVLCLGVYIHIIMFSILNFDFISPLKEFIYIYIHQVKIHLFCIYISFFPQPFIL